MFVYCDRQAEFLQTQFFLRQLFPSNTSRKSTWRNQHQYLQIIPDFIQRLTLSFVYSSKLESVLSVETTDSSFTRRTPGTPPELPEPARSGEIGGQCPVPPRSPPLSLPARLVLRVPPLSLPARLVVRVPPLCLPSPCLRLSSPCGVSFPGTCAWGARMRVFPRAYSFSNYT